MPSRASQSRNRRFNSPTATPAAGGTSGQKLSARLSPAGELSPEQSANIVSDLRLILITTGVLVVALIVLSIILR